METSSSAIAGDRPVALEPQGARRNQQVWIWIAIAMGLGLFALVGLGLVATLVVPRILQRSAFASPAKARADVVSIEHALKEYSRLNAGKFPDQLKVLVMPDVNGKTFLGVTRMPKDPWGRDYLYEPPGPNRGPPRVFSYGRDGRPGGEGEDADIYGPSIRHDR